MSKYILATREMLLYHFDYIEPYLRMKYNLLDSVHSSANMDKKSVSMGQFLFENITKELEIELKNFGFDIMYKDKKVKIK